MNSTNSMNSMSDVERLRYAADRLEAGDWETANTAIIPVWQYLQLQLSEKILRKYSDLEKEVRSLLATEGFIPAIKYVRSTTGLSLRESHSYVQALSNEVTK